MRRVFTDERFPNCEIVNDGSPVFQVFCGKRLLQSFETHEATAMGSISDEFAARRAKDYFDRWAKMSVGSELTDQVEEETPLAPEPRSRRGTPLAKEPPHPVRGSVSKTIDDLLARAKLATDPATKQAYSDRILALMKLEDSVATVVVNELIAG